MESKIRLVVAVTTLLMGPLDVGSGIISKEGVLEMILVMANSGDFLQQVDPLLYSYLITQLHLYFYIFRKSLVRLS